MVGAGVRDKCGTALVYRSQDLTEGGSGCHSPEALLQGPLGLGIAFSLAGLGWAGLGP